VKVPVDFLIMTPLCDLRWHWGGAYVISGTIGRWRAERRDNRRVLTAEGPEMLRALIIADYRAKPVPRDLPRQGVEVEGEPGVTLGNLIPHR
jgi:hypothetical protein